MPSLPAELENELRLAGEQTQMRNVRPTGTESSDSALTESRRLADPRTGYSAWSQMAEGLLRRDAGDRFTIETAGIKPSIVRPEPVAVMKEGGIDITTHRSKHVDEFGGKNSTKC
jgi:Low molecular weight phosphotyrosine protein phosphatase